MIRSVVLAFLLAGVAGAQGLPPPGPIAMERPETQAGGTLTVTSSAFFSDGIMPRRFSRYDEDVSPPLSWRGAPSRTRAYAVIVDDPDATLKPVNHWTLWNVTATSLPEHMPLDAALSGPVAGVQGTTTMRHPGYAGPHPPVGDPPHHYHFQVFALDAPLPTAPGASREALLAAMNGHVVARGELVGMYGQPSPPRN